MPTKRLSMRQLREILRLHLQSQLGVRHIHRSLRLSVGVVSKILNKAQELGLDWDSTQQLDEVQLAQLFYPRSNNQLSSTMVMPSWSQARTDLTGKNVTKYLLWEEYTQQHPNSSYSYSQYCYHFATWLGKQKRSMRQIHKAGDTLFVDYAGQTMPVVNGTTGEVRYAQIFVAVLGASNYTYAEATWSQSLPDWLGSHVRAFEFINGVPAIVVPDNLKSGVSKACRYDPETNPAYQQLAVHYGTAIIPARPYKPKDKSKAEVGVQIVERWILARLRHHTFFSLAELNACIAALLVEMNLRPFKQLDGTRQSWFDSIDRPALKPLPKLPYEYVAIKTVKVNIDYHIQYSKHLYSVPHHLVGERVDVHASTQVIGLYFHGTRVASHPRRDGYGMSTTAGHMPAAHQHHQQWTGAKLMNWAKDVGDHVLTWVKHQLKSKEHEQQAFRVCLGLLSLSRKYSAQRLNQACGLANHHELYRLQQVKDILKSNQDTMFQPSEPSIYQLPQDHENIRGPHSFH